MNTDDDKSPLETYISGGGDTSNERAMELLREADRGWHRRREAAQQHEAVAVPDGDDEDAR